MKKNILIVLGLGVIAGLGFWIAKTNSEIPVPIEGTNTPATSAFNETASLKLNEEIILPDGLRVALKEINDSRCRPGVQCIWAGEISGVFMASGGTLAVPTQVRLGTVNNKTASLEDYTFSLKDATETVITIEVIREENAVY